MPSHKFYSFSSRREFLSFSWKAGILFSLLSRNSESEVFDSEMMLKNYEVYTDEATGAKVIRLLPGPAKNTTIYQTHPMWSPDMNRFYFLSDRTSGNKMELHVLTLQTGKVSSVFDSYIHIFTLGWKTENIYYIEGNEVGIKIYGKEATILGKVPEDIESASGGIAVTPNEKWLYAGFKKKNGKFAIKRLDLKKSTWEECCEVNFPIGHVQTNQWDDNKMMFCWETGGDSPQRTWFWSEETKEAKPFFVEREELWVTHEVWWGKDSALFTIWPYDEKHFSLPHGVGYTTTEKGAKGELEILALYPAWHTHGSHNFKWVMGDDFDRNIWLIEPKKKEKRLLVKGKIKNNVKVHPHASFTPDSKGIVFNSSAFGMEEIHLVILPENFESLPKA